MSKDSEDKITFIENLKQQWMATVDAIADPLMVTDSEYNITRANKALAQLEKQSIKDILGQKCFKVFGKRRSPCPGCKMQESLASGKEQTFELDRVRTNRFHEVTAQPLYSADAQLEGMVTIYRDRTEAKLLRDQLLQSEKLASIGLLAGGIAHEINNPLGGILVFSQMILREMEPTDLHYDDVVEIEAAAQRCKEIVENLLNFARVQPKKKLRAEKVDIKSAIKTALKFGLAGSKRKDIHVVEQWNLSDHIYPGSHNRMIQLFLNIIQNAIQAMPGEGELTLTSSSILKDEKKWISFEIKDTGIGIDPEKKDLIFDPFFTSKAQGEGTGLGLSICHGIVAEYGGHIEVDSAIGEGTTFRILLPMPAQEENLETA